MSRFKKILAFFLAFLSCAGSAYASSNSVLTTTPPDLLDALKQLGPHIDYLIFLVQTIFLLLGVYYITDGLVELWAVNDDRALKYLKGRDRFSNGSAIVSCLLGGVFFAMYDLSLVGVMSRTIGATGYIDSASSGARWAWETAKPTGGDDSLGARAEYAATALYGIMQVLGLVGMMRGWMTVNAYYNNRQNAGLGTAAGWLIGGLLAWNMKWFNTMLNNTLGWNLFWFFDVKP